MATTSSAVCASDEEATATRDSGIVSGSSTRMGSVSAEGAHSVFDRGVVSIPASTETGVGSKGATTWGDKEDIARSLVGVVTDVDGDCVSAGIGVSAAGGKATVEGSL